MKACAITAIPTAIPALIHQGERSRTAKSDCSDIFHFTRGLTSAT
jgi:hypothetical protein